MNKYQFQLQPTEEQAKYFIACFGGVRFIYNHFVAELKHLMDEGYSAAEASLRCVPINDGHWQKDYPWLNELDDDLIASAEQHLDEELDNYYNTCSNTLPYHCKRSRNDQYIALSKHQGAIQYDTGRLLVPKAGWVDTVMNEGPPELPDIKKLKISRGKDGVFYASAETEYPKPGCVGNRGLGTDADNKNEQNNSERKYARWNSPNLQPPNP